MEILLEHIKSTQYNQLVRIKDRQRQKEEKTKVTGKNENTFESQWPQTQRKF